jgi:hypothetical protein
MSATEQRERAWVAYGALLIAIAGIAWSAIFIRWSPFQVRPPRSIAYSSRRSCSYRGAHFDDDFAARAQPRRRDNPAALLLALGGGVFFGLDLALYNTS